MDDLPGAAQRFSPFFLHTRSAAPLSLLPLSLIAWSAQFKTTLSALFRLTPFEPCLSLDDV